MTTPTAIGQQVWPASERERVQIESQFGAPTTYPATVTIISGDLIGLNNYESASIWASRFTTDAPTPDPLPSLAAEVIDAHNQPIEPTPRYIVGDAVMVAPAAWQRYGHSGPYVGSEYQPEHGTITAVGTTWGGDPFDYLVELPDACSAPANASELSLVAGTGSDHETPVEAPLAAVDPLDVWEAGLADSDAVLDAIWHAADQAADAADACPEYERTTAHPHGHEGRPGNEPGDTDDDDGPMGAGTVTYHRTITRTVTVRQEVEVQVDAGEDAWEAMRETYDWEDIPGTEEYDDEEEDDYGPEVYDTDRESLPSMADERTQPADLVRAALASDTSYGTIRDAILTTAQAHGAPLARRATVSLSAQVSRQTTDGWTPPTGERVDDAAVTTWEADTFAEVRTFEAYATAQRLLQASNPQPARVAHGTLAVVTKSVWEVTA